jgi:Mad3/BUB1 homology region 1
LTLLASSIVNKNSMNEVERGGTLLFQESNAAEPSSSVQKKPHEWELMKENTAPLARGRAIPPHGNNTIVSSNEIQHAIEHYEAQIALQSTASIRSDEDPLVIWLSYIKFVQESAHPSKTHQATPVFSLLERCVQTCSTHARYANDPRFIRICCLYADQTKEPLTTFQQMHQPPYRIGTESAVFFNAWAFVAEKMQLYTIAEQIFRQGLSTNVQPITYLQTRHARFQKRMSRHWLNASLQGGGDESTSPSAHLPQRTIFGSLASSTTHRASALSSSSSQPLFAANAPNQRSLSNQPQIPSTAPFPIASDDEAHHFLSQDANTTQFSASWKPEAERWKENRGPLQQWNAFGALTSAYDQELPPSSTLTTTAMTIRPSSSAHSSATAVGFDIHVDEDCVAPTSHDEPRHRAARDDRVPAKHAKEDANHKQSRFSKPMWKHRLLSHPVTKEEQSFEQARFLAGVFTLLPPSQNINLLRLCKEEEEEDRDMSMSMEELMSEHEASFTGSTTVASLTADPMRFMNSSTASTPLPNSLGSNQRPPNSLNRMLPNNEPTINTQWALRELSVMFASPAAVVPAAGEPLNTTNPDEECEANPAFAIFCDPEDDDRKAPSSHVGNPSENHPPEPSFAIFCDETLLLNHPKPCSNPSVGDTAAYNLSIPSIFPPSNTAYLVTKDVPKTTEPKALYNETTRTGASSFEIFCDPETPHNDDAIQPLHSRSDTSQRLRTNHRPSEDSPSSTAGLSVGDTATFTLSVPSLFPPSRTIDHVSKDVPNGNNKRADASSFAIFCDSETQPNQDAIPPLHPKSLKHLSVHRPAGDSPSSAAGLSVGDTAVFTLSIPSSQTATTAKTSSTHDPCISDGDTVTFSDLSEELQRVAVDRRRQSVNRLPPSFLSTEPMPKLDLAGK